VKIKLDENLPDDLASLLRAAEDDVSTVTEEGLAGCDDPPVLQAASAENRVLMSFDLGFADIRRYPAGAHAGIVVFRLKDQRWKTLQKPGERKGGREKGRGEKRGEVQFPSVGPLGGRRCRIDIEPDERHERDERDNATMWRMPFTLAIAGAGK